MSPIDSLDIVELVMAIEAAVEADPRLAPRERERLIREIQERIERGEFGDLDGFDDDALAAWIRKLGPREPRDSADAVAPPKDPLFE